MFKDGIAALPENKEGIIEQTDEKIFQRYWPVSFSHSDVQRSIGINPIKKDPLMQKRACDDVVGVQDMRFKMQDLFIEL